MPTTGRGDLLHGFESGIFRRQPVLNVVFNRLDHHDGVIHNQTNGQHQAEE